MKQDWKPGTMIYPLPALWVSCGSTPEDYNLFTVAWAGTICTNPAMCYISVRPERHSYALIKQNMEFVLNLTTEDMAYATDWCGVRSGRDYRKFEEMKLTPGKARMVAAPIVEESPLSIECRVKEIVSLGWTSRAESGVWTPVTLWFTFMGLTMVWVGKSVNSAGAWRKRKNEIQLFKVNKDENRHNSI